MAARDAVIAVVSRSLRPRQLVATRRVNLWAKEPFSLKSRRICGRLESHGCEPYAFPRVRPRGWFVHHAGNAHHRPNKHPLANDDSSGHRPDRRIPASGGWSAGSVRSDGTGSVPNHDLDSALARIARSSSPSIGVPEGIASSWFIRFFGRFCSSRSE
jgi:hypothetical protein